MVSTFVAYWLLNSYALPWWLAVAIALCFAVLQGIAVQQLVIRPLIGGPCFRP